jgi:hypothetical protein
MSKRNRSGLDSLRAKLQTSFYGEVETSTTSTDSSGGIPGPQGPPGPPGSDATVTKAAVEAVLTGTITTHSHAGGAHTQGTDQYLDQGGANEISAANAKAAYTHSGTAHAPSNAEQNVNADWNSVSGDSQILNKPTLGTAAAQNIPVTGDASATEVVYGTDTRLTNSRNAADVSAWAKSGTKPSYTYSEVGAEQSGAVSTHAALSTGVHGSGANSLIYSNDSRLTDSRTPTSHTHAQSDVTNLTTDLSNKQATLVSGSNIKTINSNSILGAGDLVISGSGLTHAQVLARQL